VTEGLLELVRDTRQALKQGAAGINERQRTRFAGMVAYARAHSPYYRELYKDIPERVDDARVLPITSKSALMARFDEWATDREVTLEKARTFAANPELIGERFLGRLILATTSGTTGIPGIFVIDDRTLRVVNALMLRWLQSLIGVADVLRIVAEGRRLAMVADLGHHSATSVAAARLMKSPARRKRIQLLSVRTPLPDLVAQLNAFRPALLAPYASMAKLLASEQGAGRLQIHPVLIVQRPDPCPCGNPLPAIRVQGRSADVLSFRKSDGAQVSIAPLAFEVDHIPGVEQFQVVQTTPTNVRVRYRLAGAADSNQVWQAVHADIARVLAQHGLESVTVERTDELPHFSAQK